VPPNQAQEKEPWSLPISLFKTYRFTTDKLINECFEADWAATRVARIIKDPEVYAAAKEKLRKAYKVM
jgi:hypothetical protein